MEDEGYLASCSTTRRETCWGGARGKGPRQKQRGAVQPADVLPWCAPPVMTNLAVLWKRRAGANAELPL
ncbi:hypothetical protein ACVXG8_01205 [Escherichia coli]